MKTNRFNLFAPVIAASLASLTVTHAATKTWDAGGGDLLWSTANNWNTNGVPANGDTVVFASSFSSGTAIDLNGNRTIADLSITNTTDFSLNNNTLTITSGDIARSAASGTSTINSAVALGGNAAWDIQGNLTLNGAITGDFSFTKTSSGTLTINNTNASTKTFTIESGIVAVGNNSALGTGTVAFQNGAGGAEIRSASSAGYTVSNAITLQDSPVVISGTGALEFNSSSGVELKGGGAVLSVTNTALTTFSGAGTNGAIWSDNIRTLTVDVSTTSGGVLVSGAVKNGPAGTADELTLIKQGGGTMTLSGTNTYTGTTSVSGGTLVVNGNQTTAGGNITVANNARLEGTGTAGADLTTIQSGGTLKSGLDFNNSGATVSDLAFSSGSVFEWDINSAGGFSLSDVEGTVTGSGATFKILLTDTSGSYWNTDRTWNLAAIFAPTNNVTLSSIFGTLDTNFNAVGGGRGFSFSGGNLTWAAIPEPSTALAGLLLGAGLLRRRRRA